MGCMLSSEKNQNTPRIKTFTEMNKHNYMFAFYLVPQSTEILVTVIRQ